MIKRAKNIYDGTSLDQMLDEDGMRGEVESAAIKNVLAWQMSREMERQQKTKKALAEELGTSRSQVDRLLDPSNVTVSLETVSRAAVALGGSLVFEFRPKRRARKSSLVKAG